MNHLQFTFIKENRHTKHNSKKTFILKKNLNFKYTVFMRGTFTNYYTIHNILCNMLQFINEQIVIIGYTSRCHKS